MRGLTDYSREAGGKLARFTNLSTSTYLPTARALTLIANLVNERRHWMRLSNWSCASDVETRLTSASTLAA